MASLLILIISPLVVFLLSPWEKNDNYRSYNILIGYKIVLKFQLVYIIYFHSLCYVMFEEYMTLIPPMQLMFCCEP